MGFDPDPPEPPSEEIVIFDGNVEWTEQYGAYYAYVTITQPLSPLLDVKLTVDGTTFNSTLNNNGFLFIDSGGTPIGMLSPDYLGSTTCSLVMAQLPVDNHVLITVEEIEAPVFYQGVVNCDTQGSGETPSYYGFFTANYSASDGRMLVGTANGVQVVGVFNNSICNLTENLMISHRGGYDYTLTNFSNESITVTLDLKVLESSQPTGPDPT